MTGMLVAVALAAAVLLLPGRADRRRSARLLTAPAGSAPGSGSSAGTGSPLARLRGVVGRRRASTSAADRPGDGHSGRDHGCHAGRHGTAREAQVETGHLIAFLDILAPSLRAGRTPEEAARLACEVIRGSAVVDAVGDAVASGRSIETVLTRQAERYPQVRFVAQAWQLSARTGCPLADAVESAGRAVRARLDHERRVVSVAAGAATTIRILTLLPLGGPLLAMAVGVDPVDAYVSSPTAWACVAVGAVLVVLGRLWVRRLVDAVARGPVLVSTQ